MKMSEKTTHVSRESSIRRRKTAYHYRRRSKALFVDQYTAELKHVLGLTLKTNSCFSCDPHTGLLAYPAGCVIVLYNPRQDHQTHIFNPGQKTLTCLQFSHDGNFIVTGEAGHQPCVRVFSSVERNQIAAFSSHKYGISCVAFSPSGKYVVSIGFQHDNVINVWDWKKSKLAASNKVSTKIKSVAFSENSRYFITVGNRHVKFWYMEEPSSDKVTVPLKGRSAILETLRNQVFCDVACGICSDSKYAFAITRSGILCQFNAGRTAEKYVELKSGNSRSVCTIKDMVLCGCGSGSIQIFTSSSLDYFTEIMPVEELRDIEIIAMAVDAQNMWLHCVFDDHSFVVCDVMDVSSPNVHSLSHFHNSCVWDVKVLPSGSECESLPNESFVTCSNDRTVRAWSCDGDQCNLLKILRLDDSSGRFESRSLALRRDGRHLAVGDRSGNIHVFDLEKFEKIAFLPTHEGDVLCMDYSIEGDILASASRDRCIHTFDSSYLPTHTIADHSAAVTSVKFSQLDDDFRLITCGADKSLYFCSIVDCNGKTEMNREQHFVERHSMSDMAVLDDSVLVACGCNLNEYDVIGGKLRRTFKGSESSVGIIRVAVNNHRTLIATSCADKNVYLLSFNTGDCICVLTGHSEVAVALTFDLDNRLLSASADGCVFIWILTHRIPEDARNIQTHPGNWNSNVSTPDSPDLDRTAYFAQSAPSIEECIEQQVVGPHVVQDQYNHSEPINGVGTGLFKAEQVDPPADETENVIDLPTWVTKIVSADFETTSDQTPRLPLGKWGERLEPEKVREELGNLPVSVDVSSMRSSIDENEVYSDCRSEPTSVEEVTSKTEEEEVLDVEVIDAEAEAEADESEDTTIKNESPNDNSNHVESEIAESKYVYEEVVEKLNSDDIAGAQEKSSPVLACDQPDTTLNSCEMSEKIEDFYSNSDKLKISQEFFVLAEKNVIYDKTAQHSHTLPPNIQSTNMQERLVDDRQISAPVLEEDVDLRKAFYQNRNNEIDRVNKYNISPHTSDDERTARSTPTHHYMTTANIKLNPTSTPQTKLFKKSISHESFDRDDHLAQKMHRSKSAAAIDSASKELVNQVYASIDCLTIEECGLVTGKSSNQSESPLNPTSQTSPYSPFVVSHTHAKRGEIPIDQSKEIVYTVPDYKKFDKSYQNQVTKQPNDFVNEYLDCTSAGSKQSTDPTTINSSTPISSTTNHRKPSITDRPNSMPPAFAELLASLSKSKSFKQQTSSNKTNPSTCRHERAGRARSLVNEPRSVARSTELNRFTKPSPFTNVANQRINDIDECHEASENLLAAFDKAESLYKRCKIKSESFGGSANGDLDGFNALSQSLQHIYSRLNQLQDVANLLDFDLPNKRSSNRSVSLNNLTSESPVVSLLREYSDKLVGLVNTQVDNKLLTTPTDTI